MTPSELLTTLTDLTAALARAESSRRSRTLPVHVPLMLLLIAEGNQRGETVTVAALGRYLGLHNSSLFEGLSRLVDAGLVVHNPKRPSEVHRDITITAAAVDLLRHALLTPDRLTDTRTTVFPEPQPNTPEAA